MYVDILAVAWKEMLIEMEENVASRCWAVMERIHEDCRAEERASRLEGGMKGEGRWRLQGVGTCLELSSLPWIFTETFFQLSLGIHTLTWCNFLPVFSCTAVSLSYALHRLSRFICLLLDPQTDWRMQIGITCSFQYFWGSLIAEDVAEVPAAMTLWGRISPSSGALSSVTRCFLGRRISQREDQPFSFFYSENKWLLYWRELFYHCLWYMMTVCPHLPLEGPTPLGALPAPLSAVSPPVGHSCLDDKIRGSRARIFSL